MLKTLFLGAAFSWSFLGTTPQAPFSNTILQQQQTTPAQQATRLANEARFARSAKELEAVIQKLEALLQQYPELRTTKIPDTKFTGDELLAQWKTKYNDMFKAETLETKGLEVAQVYKKAAYVQEPGEAPIDAIISYLELADSVIKTIQELVAKTPELKGYKLPDIRITPEEAITKIDAKAQKAALLIGVYELTEILQQFAVPDNDPDRGNNSGEADLERLAKRMDDNVKLMQDILKINPSLAKRSFNAGFGRALLGEQIGPECARRAARARARIIELRQGQLNDNVKLVADLNKDLSLDALMIEFNKKAQVARNAKTMPDVLNAFRPFEAVFVKLESLNIQLKKIVTEKPAVLSESINLKGKPTKVKDYVTLVSSTVEKASKEFKPFEKKFSTTLDTYYARFQTFVKKNIKGDRKSIYAQRGGPNLYDGPDIWIMPEKRAELMLKSPYWIYEYFDRNLDINCKYMYRFNGDKLTATERTPSIC